jgi:hypothetical protein
MIPSTFINKVSYFSKFDRSFSDQFFELLSKKEYNSCLILVMANPNFSISSHPGPIYLYRNIHNDSLDTPFILKELLKFFLTYDGYDANFSTQMFSALDACFETRKDLIKEDATFSEALELTIFTLLTKLPRVPCFVDSQFNCIKWLLQQVCARNCTGLNDIQIIQELALNKYVDFLHLFICNPEASVLTVLRENNFISEKYEKRYFKCISEEVLNSYRVLCYIWWEFYDLSFLDQMIFIRDYNSHFKKLEKINFPELDKLKARIDSTIYSTSNLMKSYESIYQKWKETGCVSKEVDRFFYVEGLIQYAVFKNDRAFLLYFTIVQFEYCDERLKSRIIYHFMMDKLAIPKLEDYEGMRAEESAGAMIYSLTRLREDNIFLHVKKEVTDTINKVISFFIPLLQNYIFLINLNHTTRVSKILNHINSTLYKFREKRVCEINARTAASLLILDKQCKFSSSLKNITA